MRDGYLRPYIKPSVAVGPCNYQVSMGRCVIFALGEILISALSAATWMDEPGSLQPRLTFPQRLRQRPAVPMVAAATPATNR